MPPRILKKNNFEFNSRIIGLAGKKGAGKDAAARFIAGINLVTHGYIDEFHSLNNGDIEIAGKKIKDVNTINPEFVKVYHFADYLKEICHNIFGVSWQALNVFKDSNTICRWENMPGVVTNEEVYNAVQKFLEKKRELVSDAYTLPIMYHRPGIMTARQLLQYLGTEVFRRIHSDCWIECILNKINDEKPKIAIVADARFTNELDAIKAVKGKCIKLTRTTGVDEHVSEIDFLSYQDWDAIIDNAHCKDIRCLNQLLYEGLVELGIYNTTL